ncbi:MAG: hypothetical protein Tsb009_31270 [Planctomycetaceae bacterium]
MKKRFFCRFLIVLMIFAGLKFKSCPLFAQDEFEPTYPKYEEMIKNIPTVKELLTGKPVDWIVLNNDDVIIAEPVSPRPETLKKIEARIAESLKWPIPQTRAERAEQNEKRRLLPYLFITLRDGGENPERKIHKREIREIIHHEDLLLRRIGILQDEGDLALSFELLFNLKRRKPNWPTIAQYENRQLLAEGKRHYNEKRAEAALAVLEELHGRNPKFPGLKELLGDVANRLITDALNTNDYRRARHYIGRLQRREPQHPIFIKWRDDLSARATKHLNAARTASREKKHDEAAKSVAEAVKIWPATPGLRGAYDAMMRRFQTLRVGVVRFSSAETTNLLSTMADARQEYLSETPLFEAQGYFGSPSRDDAIYYQTKFFDEWEPNDLGRRTVFKLQIDRPYYQPQPVVTASDIAKTLRARIQPQSPDYDERLASYIKSFTVLSPSQLQIRFSRVPPRLESLLNFPLTMTQPESTRSKSATSTRSASPRFVPYRRQEWTENQQVFRRFLPEPENVPENRYHVAQVEEKTFDSHEKAIQALKRGTIHMLANVRVWHVNQLKKDERFDVRQYAFPVTHVLQFNPESETLKSRELRRALRYALNREDMLRKIALRTHEGGDPDYGRVVTGPFSSQSYATSGIVKPVQPDIILALALKIVVNRQHERAHNAALGPAMFVAISPDGEQNGYIPTLRMVIPPGEVTREVAEKCVETWDRIGLKVQIVPARQAIASGEWDIVYRKVKMVDPIVDLWPFLTFENRARVESLKHFPDWLRQELIRLDFARDWQQATETLRNLHQHLAEQAHLLPLFEVDDFLAIRKTVSAFNDSSLRPVHTYQNIEQWIVNPWYPPNAP